MKERYQDNLYISYNLEKIGNYIGKKTLWDILVSPISRRCCEILIDRNFENLGNNKSQINIQTEIYFEISDFVCYYEARIQKSKFKTDLVEKAEIETPYQQLNINKDYVNIFRVNFQTQDIIIYNDLISLLYNQNKIQLPKSNELLRKLRDKIIDNLDFELSR